VVVLVAVLAVGCGSHREATGAPTAPTTPATTTARVQQPKGCLPGLERALAGAESGQVRLTGQTRVTGVEDCRYLVARPKHPGCTVAAASVDTDPQPYYAFNRWEVEAGQNVSQNDHPDLALYPQVVADVGTGADWVPGHQLIEAINTTRWVSVQLTCPTRSHPLRLAETLARAALTDPLGAG
jgi:hypothetical protein